MRTLKSFLRDERGSHTIEFVIWIPLFLFFLATTIDVSMIYLTHTEMWNVARDAARRVSTGDLAEGQPAEDFIAQSLAIYSRDRSTEAASQYNIRVTKDEDADEVTVEIAAWAGEAGLFGLFGFIGERIPGVGRAIVLQTTVIMRSDPFLD